MYTALTTIAEDSLRQMHELHQAHALMLARLTSTADAGSPVPVTLPALPLGRLNTWQELITQSVTRQMQSCQALVRLAMQPQQDASLLTEGLAIQAAVMKRLATQQAQWLEGLQAIASEAARVRRVNTLSKLMDQESDLYARFNALLASQATATMELIESVQISVGYLVAQKEEETE
ncbi:hypothetical protein [Zoogloea sp.]|uniref:hypothetical protein n=1 Tax=Zoogloea sp. TaxID=49181 RepID=UPI001416D7E8|nr:MAG: hypothetical protein F9K15_19725 [Zoogloea sp.]